MAEIGEGSPPTVLTSKAIEVLKPTERMLVIWSARSAFLLTIGRRQDGRNHDRTVFAQQCEELLPDLYAERNRLDHELQNQPEAVVAHHRVLNTRRSLDETVASLEEALSLMKARGARG